MGAPVTVSTQQQQLPPPIGAYVRRYVVLRRRHALARSFGLAVSCFLAWALGCCMLDRVFGLASAARLALLATGVVAMTVIVFRPLVYWLSRDVNWRAAAADIERRDWGFAQRLQTVTSTTLAPERLRASPEIIDALSREVASELEARPPARLVRWKPTVLPWLLALSLAVVAAGLVAVPVVGMRSLAARLLLPLRPTPRVTTTRLAMHPPTASVIEGEALKVRVSAERLPPGGGVSLAYTRPGGSWTSVPMTHGRDGAFEAILGPVTQDLRYLARGGDARTDIGVVRVLRKPTLSEARIRYAYPAYTGRAPLAIANADGLIEAPIGSEAEVTYVASVPLALASLTMGDQKLDLVPAADSASAGRAWRTMLNVTKDATYSLSMRSVDGVEGVGPASMSIRAIPDRPPLAQVLQPPGELRLHPRDILSLPFQALDDYGVTSLTTNVQITASGVDASGEPINLAKGKPATQPTTWGGADGSRAVDGNTDGNFLAGSVSHADIPGGWWQVDLGNVEPVAVVEVWNRADAVPERLSDFFVFVSDAPFLSDDPAAIGAQAGVATHRIAGTCGRPTTIEVFRTARFVRVQLSKPEYLSLAEVRVLQAKPAAAGEAASRSFNSNIAIAGDPRQQEGEAVLDLAKIKVGVGDVIAVSVTATDTGKQAATGGPIRVVVSPRSIDQRTYDRIGELKRASQHAAALVAQLDGAAASFAPAGSRGVGHIDAYLAALATANRELSAATETAAALQSALLRCVIRSDGLALSVALAGMIDDAQQVSAAATALGAGFAFDSAPTEADRAAFATTTAAARRIAADVNAILRGEQAGAILADLDNLRATEQGTPTAKDAADRARERARRVREDVVGAARELGLAPETPELEATLKAMTAARSASIASYAVRDFAPPAAEYAKAVGAGEPPRSSLVPRLSAAAQAEAVRHDGNLGRARDLQLAATAALRVREAPAATQHEFVRSFAGAIAALQREHSIPRELLPATSPAPSTAAATTATSTPTTNATTNATTAAPQPSAEVRAAAAEARRQLALWAKGESEESVREADATARAQALAMQANADLAARDYDLAEAADERILSELKLAERTFPRAAARFEAARRDVRRSTDRAKEIDRIVDQQQQVAQRARQSGQPDIGEQRRVAAAIETTAAPEEGDEFPGNVDDQFDSRMAAVTALRVAQERLAAMPQQVRDVEAAVADRAAAAERLRIAQLDQVAAAEESRAAAARAVRDAEQQLREAEALLAERLRPINEVTVLELSRSLAVFAPETSAAVRAVRDGLYPTVSRLQQRAAGGAAGEMTNAVANVRSAIDSVQTELKAAQSALLERDPLFAARVFAEAASSASNADAAAAQQQNASAALARAWDASIHEAAAARLAGLPTMRSLFAHPPAPSAAGPSAGAAATSLASKFPALFEWGRFPWPSAPGSSPSPRASDPPGYQDALQAYFEALGSTRTVAPTTGPTTQP